MKTIAMLLMTITLMLSAQSFAATSKTPEANAKITSACKKYIQEIKEKGKSKVTQKDVDRYPAACGNDPVARHVAGGCYPPHQVSDFFECIGNAFTYLGL